MKFLGDIKMVVQKTNYMAEKGKISFRLPKTVIYKEAKKVICDIVRQIEAERDLMASDIPLLHRMATAYNAYIACTIVVAEQGLTMENLKGEWVKRPEANLLKENWAQYLELAKEYGLTAKSRSQIRGKVTESGEEDSPADEYFKKKAASVNG